MKPILFESNETTFESNGLGRIDAISCEVTEERNGQYDLEMEVSIDDEHFQDIKEGRILYVRHDETQDKQPFDIYYISRPLNGIVSVLARHISYRTQGITVSPFTASGIQLALMGLKSNSIGNNPFTFWTDKVTTGTYSISQPKTLRSLLGGEEGSILDVFGTGEYEWDKFNIKLNLHRGRDSGVVLRYGKDLTDLNKTTDASNVWTGIVPYWYGTPNENNEGESSDEEVLVMLPEVSVMSSRTGVYPHEIIIPVDMTSEFEDVPTVEQLRAIANSYVNEKAPASIPTTIEFSFINLAEYDEYKNVAALQRLRLCDTVTVQYDKLGVSNTAKIIRTVFDVLTEKYKSMTVGDVSSDLSSTLTSGIKVSIDDLKKSTTRNLNKTRSKLEQSFQKTIDEQTALITGGSGGHVVLKQDADGKPTDILIMDSEDINQAQNVLRINVNGIGFSSTGVDGEYKSAWTLDGKFNANWIQAGELDVGLAKVGTLTDATGANYWNLETGDLRIAPSAKYGSGGATFESAFDEKAGIFYGTFRTGSSSYFTPDSATVGVAVGDMRFYYPNTYICTSTSPVEWAAFTAAKEGDYFVDNYTGSTYRWDGSKWVKVTDYQGAIKNLDNSLNQEAIFNRLTNNGAMKGLFLNAEKNQLYINADYINSGTMVADRISGGELTDKSGKNKWNLTTGAMNFATLSWTADHSSLSSDGHLWCEGAEISGELKTTYHDYYDARTFWFHDGRLSGYGFKTQYARNTDDYSDTTGISESNIVRFDLDMQLGSNNSNSYVALEATNGAYIGLRSNEGIYGQSSNNYSDFGVHPRYVEVDTPTLNINAKTIHVSDSTYQGYGVTGGGWTYNSAGGAVTLYFVNGLLVDVGGATSDNGWNFN